MRGGRYRDAAELIRAALAALDASNGAGDGAGAGSGDGEAPPSRDEGFRLALEEGLRGQSDPLAAMACAAELLGSRLGAARAGYWELDDGAGTLRMAWNWTSGHAAGPGGEAQFREAFSQEHAARLRAGRMLVAGGDDAGAGGATPVAWASVVAPLLEAGALKGVLCVQSAPPRPWSPAEVALVRHAAERSWETAGRLRVEAALRESEERHRVLFEAAPFSVIIIDPATHAVLDVNAFACAAYGHPREAFLGMNIADLDVLGEADAIRARGRAGAIRPGVQEFEARHRTADGTIRDVLVRVQGVRLGGRDVTYGAHFDITARKAAEAALRASEARLRLAVEGARLSTWEFDLRRGTGSRAGPLQAALPHVPGQDFPLSRWLDAIHPEERAAVESRFWGVVQDATPRFEAEFRVRRSDGQWAWISSFGAVVERDGTSGLPTRVAGVAQDITDRRAAEERRALLMREVDHRAKNALAVVQATLRLTQASDLESFRAEVEGRVAAIARAQTLLADESWSGADLHALLEGGLAPFLGGEKHRARLEGPRVTLPPGAAQPFAMAVHELATNATKHGALSTCGGEVRVAWRLGDDPRDTLHLRWTEAGGPALPGPPVRRGFGSRVLEGTVRHQLGGTVTLHWEGTGLICEIELPLSRTTDKSNVRAEGG